LLTTIDQTENGIVGEALVALRHEELKEMGINSVGHRLTILKTVYEMKVKQGVPLEADHYIPLCMSPPNRVGFCSGANLSTQQRSKA
jgi:hypothetical protein